MQVVCSFHLIAFLLEEKRSWWREARIWGRTVAGMGLSSFFFNPCSHFFRGSLLHFPTSGTFEDHLLFFQPWQCLFPPYNILFLCLAILFKPAQVLLIKKACIRLFSELGMPTWECMKIWCVVPTIANISHHPYHRRWCTIFKSVPFWRRKRHFWLFCRKLRHFLEPPLQT